MPSTLAPHALPEPTRSRWTALRAGIQNVWEYDDRRFVFTRGRLLLRGQNEAGKTKALELLFPFLLDADLAPQRLDPFGSTARPMRWNLMNEQDPDQQLRVGYVWLELGRLDGDRPEYVTLGAGLKARRSAPDVEHWFFLTSRRPDQDLSLLEEDGRPRVRAALEEAIGEAGQVFERRVEYRRALNAKLFSLGDEQYAALVDTLLHLRRPQLSKTLDPEQLSTFLTDALPPLDAAVIGPIAEGFERLDHHRAELENLIETLAKLEDFAKVYRTYARSRAREQATALGQAEGAYQRARADARARAAERDALAATLASAVAALTELDRRESELSARIAALQDSDAFRAAAALDASEQQAEAAGRRAAEACERAERDARDLGDAGRTCERRDRAVAAGAAANRVAGEAAEAAAEAACLGGPHGAIAEAAGRGDAARAEGALHAVRVEREAALSRLGAAHAEHARAQAAHRVAEERARDRAEERDAARASLATAERAAAEAFEGWAGEVERWRSGLVELRGAPFAEVEEGADPAAVRSDLDAVAAPVRQSLADEAAHLRAERRELESRRSALSAERDALAAAPHALPAPPAWRAPRPADRGGAPLYELCELGPSSASEGAGFEAALEASGLLDAWVEPDGTIVDAQGDAFVRGAAAPGRTLADVLVPVAAGGVTVERARDALARIGVVEAGATSDGACWVSPDGRFRLGALEGAHRKDAPAYVGAPARARERARRLAELDAALAALASEIAGRLASEERLEARRERLARELAAFPGGAAVQARRAEVSARAELLEGARSRAEDAERVAARAASESDERAARLDRTAVELGVAPFARDPGRLGALSAAWVARAEALVAAVRELSRARDEASAAAEAAARARDRSGASAEEAARAGTEASEATARAAALREASGAARDEVLEKLRAARGERDEVQRGRRRAASEHGDLLQELGSARAQADVAEHEAGNADGGRRSAAEAYRALARTGLLAAAGAAPAEPPGEWSYTATLEHARSLAPATEEGGDGDAAVERKRTEDTLMRRQTELVTQLPPAMRIIPSRSVEAEVLTYQLTWNGHTRALAEVLAEIEAEVAARNALLGKEESELLERFLTGEAHEHLAARLRAARALVDRMNAALEPRVTSAGAQVRLHWTLDEAGGRADAREAVPLFFRGGALLSEANRRTLREFLEHRLAEARDVEDERPLQERLAAVLDYRRWHRFEVQHREPGQAWTRLTRKAHGAGSGGKKSVMLHLPLFAAVAAFYDSASRDAPRLIGLDEAFAGIDKPTRASLMGLLAEFDLDFVMTSFEEWGFYPQLDGLSTYHLTREPGVRGVYAEWFLWDGKERTLVDAS